MTINRRKKTTPKEQGNREERKQAKLLGDWMFDDPTFLRKSEGSGSTHIVWTGDVVPVKKLPIEFKEQWVFTIEIKNGYGKHLPTYWKNDKMLNWTKKCHKESKIYNQHIILLITQFPHRPALSPTNYMIKCIPFNVAWPVEIETGEIIYMYTYNQNIILKYKFNDIYNIQEIINSYYQKGNS